MKNLCIESPKETNQRIDAMLTEMVVEAGLLALEGDKYAFRFSLRQIGDFCGCSKTKIERIELRALRKIKEACYNETYVRRE